VPGAHGSVMGKQRDSLMIMHSLSCILFVL
jgi:hypothetical protein